MRMPITWLDNNTDANCARKVAVIRNGYLIWNWPETNVVTRVKSVSKSFINTALGLLIDDGRCLLSTLAKNYDPVLVQRYSTVTLRHITTQTSAMTVKEEPHDCDAQGRCDWSELVPPLAPIFAPGTHFRYWEPPSVVVPTNHHQAKNFAR
jgi:CubicO group peptidase (beta-lactamase class C family)